MKTHNVCATFGGTMLLAAATGVLLIAGCATGTPGSSIPADVAAVESALTAAEKLATVYVALPLCTGTNGPLCSSASLSAQIKAADNTAYTTVKAAEAGSATLAAAQDAVAKLTNLTGTIPAPAIPTKGT